jgi:hypothetical protein
MSFRRVVCKPSVSRRHLRHFRCDDFSCFAERRNTIAGDDHRQVTPHRRAGRVNYRDMREGNGLRRSALSRLLEERGLQNDDQGQDKYISHRLPLRADRDSSDNFVLIVL